MLLDILGIRTADDPDLGRFDENEVNDLPLHVRQCGRRFRALDKKLNTAIRLILVLCFLYAINNIAIIKSMVLGAVQ